MLRGSLTFITAFFSALFALAFVSTLHGCDPMPPDADFKRDRREYMTREWKDFPLARYHDDTGLVTCWTFRDEGLSCLPDKDVRRPDAGN